MRLNFVRARHDIFVVESFAIFPEFVRGILASALLFGSFSLIFTLARKQGASVFILIVWFDLIWLTDWSCANIDNNYDVGNINQPGGWFASTFGAQRKWFSRRGSSGMPNQLEFYSLHFLSSTFSIYFPLTNSQCWTTCAPQNRRLANSTLSPTVNIQIDSVRLYCSGTDLFRLICQPSWTRFETASCQVVLFFALEWCNIGSKFPNFLGDFVAR